MVLLEMPNIEILPFSWCQTTGNWPFHHSLRNSSPLLSPPAHFVSPTVLFPTTRGKHSHFTSWRYKNKEIDGQGKESWADNSWRAMWQPGFHRFPKEDIGRVSLYAGVVTRPWTLSRNGESLNRGLDKLWGQHGTGPCFTSGELCILFSQ